MRALANVNGTITPIAEAKISVLDRGFQYGDSIYEVTRTYKGVPFFLEEHFERLENSARLAKMRLSQSRAQLTDEIRRTVLECSPQKGEDAFIRYTISRGVGPLDLDPATATHTSYVILVKEIPGWDPKFYSSGVVLAIPSVVRNSPLALDPNIKSGNYLNNILAVAEAREQGADDALLLSADGKLTEASNSNVNFVINGGIRTPLHEPGTQTGNLRGITRTLIAKLASELNISYEEAPMLPSQLEQASECFVSSATREVMPVKAILSRDGKRFEFPSGGGPVTQKIRSAYDQFVAAYVSKRQDQAWF